MTKLSSYYILNQSILVSRNFYIILLLVFASLSNSAEAQITLSWSSVDLNSLADCGDGFTLNLNGNNVDITDLEGDSCVPCTDPTVSMGCDDGIGLCGDLNNTIVSDLADATPYSMITINATVSSGGTLEEQCTSMDRLIGNVSFVRPDNTSDNTELFFIQGDASQQTYSAVMDNSCSEYIGFVVSLTGGNTAKSEVYNVGYSFQTQTASSSSLPSPADAGINIPVQVVCPGDMVPISLDNCNSCNQISATPDFGGPTTSNSGNSLTILIPSVINGSITYDISYSDGVCDPITFPITFDIADNSNLSNFSFPPVCPNATVSLPDEIGTVTGNWSGPEVLNNEFNSSGASLPEQDYTVTFSSSDCGGVMFDKILTLTSDQSQTGQVCNSAIVPPSNPRVEFPIQNYYCSGQTITLTADVDATCSDCSFTWVRQDNNDPFPVPGTGDPTQSVTLLDIDPNNPATSNTFTLEYTIPGDPNPIIVTPDVVVPILQLLGDANVVSCQNDPIDLNQYVPAGVTGVWNRNGFPISGGIYSFDGVNLNGVVTFRPSECSEMYVKNFTFIPDNFQSQIPTLTTACSTTPSINLTQAPYNIDLAFPGHWELNGVTVTVLDFSMLNAASNPQVLEYIADSPTACLSNVRKEFNLIGGAGDNFMIDGDTLNLNNNTYCFGQSIRLTVPALNGCNGCIFYWNELDNPNIWIEQSDADTTITIYDPIAEATSSGGGYAEFLETFNSFRFTYTNPCSVIQNTDTLRWTLTPVRLALELATDGIDIGYCEFYADGQTAELIFDNPPGQLNGVAGTFSGNPNVTADGQFNLSAMNTGTNQFTFSESKCGESVDFEVEIFRDQVDPDPDPIPNFCMDNSMFDLTLPVNGVRLLQDGEPVLYSGDNIDFATQMINLNVSAGIYTAQYQSQIVTDRTCKTGTVTYEILAPIPAFRNDFELCIEGAPIDLKTLANGVLPASGGMFLLTQDPTNTDLSGAEQEIFDPQFFTASMTPYEFEYIPPPEYIDCELGQIFFSVLIKDVVQGNTVPFGNLCELDVTSYNIQQIFANNGVTTNGTFDMEGAVDQNNISDFTPNSLPVGNYLIKYLPANLNAECRIDFIEFEVIAADPRPIAVRDTTICQRATLDLRELISVGSGMGNFESLPPTIGLGPDGFQFNADGFQGDDVMFIYEEAASGSSCINAGTDQFTVTVENAISATVFGPGTLCTDNGSLDLDSLFHTAQGRPIVDGQYFLSTTNNTDIVNQIIDPKIFIPTDFTEAAYEIIFQPTDSNDDDSCVTLDAMFTIEGTQVFAGNPMNGTTCGGDMVDLTTFITGAQGSNQSFVSAIPGEVPISNIAFADFTGVMTGAYDFYSIVEGENPCPGIPDSTLFTVTYTEVSGPSDITITVCEGTTSVNAEQNIILSCTASDCDGIYIGIDNRDMSSVDLSDIDVSGLTENDDYTITADFTPTNNNPNNCSVELIVTIDIIPSGGGSLMVDDIDFCIGSLFDLTAHSSTVGLEWYLTFIDVGNTANILVPTPNAADLSGLTSLIAVLPDPNCPSQVTVMVNEMNATSLIIDDIDFCIGEDYDLTTHSATAGLEWYSTYIAAGDAANLLVPTPEAADLSSFGSLIAVFPDSNCPAQTTVTVNTAIEPSLSVLDIEVCPGELYDLTNHDTLVGLEYYENFEGYNDPANILVPNPDAANLDGLTQIAVVLPGTCPTFGFLAVSCPTLPVDLNIEEPITVCRGESFDLTSLMGASPNIVWYSIFVGPNDPANQVITDPTMAILDSPEIVAELDDGTSVDTQGITIIIELPPIVEFNPIDGDPACTVPNDGTYSFVVNVTPQTAVPIDLGLLPDVGTVSTNNGIATYTIVGVAASDGPFDIVFQDDINGCTDTLTIVPPMGCDPANCVLPDTPLFDLVSSQVCTSADFPSINITNPNPDFEYIWSDEQGIEILRGTSFPQTALGELSVSAISISDPACVSGVLATTGVTSFGQINIPPSDFTAGCDMNSDTFRYTLTISDFANLSQAPTADFPAGTGNIVLTDSMAGVYVVSFANPAESTVTVTLMGDPNCDPTLVPLIAPACMMTTMCSLPLNSQGDVFAPSISDIGGGVYCDASVRPIFDAGSNNYDNTLYGVRWYNDAAGTNAVFDGEQFMPSDEGVFTARFFNLNDPSCPESDVSSALTYEIGTVDATFTLEDFCFDNPQPAVFPNGQPNGFFQLDPPPQDGTDIDANGVITTTNRMGEYNVVYTVLTPCPGEYRLPQPVRVIDVPDVEELDVVITFGTDTYNILFRASVDIAAGDEILVIDPVTGLEIGNPVVPCSTAITDQCPIEGDGYYVDDIPVGTNVEIQASYAGLTCFTPRIIASPDPDSDCQTLGILAPIELDSLRYEYCANDPLPTLQVKQEDIDIIIQINNDLSMILAEPLTIGWYDQEIDGDTLATGFSFTPTAQGIYYATMYVELSGNGQMDEICNYPVRTQVDVVEIPGLNAGLIETELCEINSIQQVTPINPNGTFSLVNPPNTDADIDQNGVLMNLIPGETYVVLYDLGSTCSTPVETALVYYPVLVAPIINLEQCDASNDFYSVMFSTDATPSNPTAGTLVPGGGSDYTIEDIPKDTPVSIDLTSVGDCETGQFLLSAGLSCVSACDAPILAAGTLAQNTYCMGSEPLLGVEVPGGLSADQVVEWYIDDPDDQNNFLANGLTFQTTQQGNYFVLVTDNVAGPTGCRSAALPIQTTAETAPDPTFSYNASQCEGATFSPTLNPVSNGVWEAVDNSGNPVATFNNSTGEFVNPSAGIYTIKYITSFNNCEDSLAIDVEVFSIPNPLTDSDTTLIFDAATMMYSISFTTMETPNANTGNLDVDSGIYTLSDLSPGDLVSLTLTNAAGCVSDAFEFTLPAGSCPMPASNPNLTAQPTCFRVGLTAISSPGAGETPRWYENRDRTGFVTDDISLVPPSSGTFYLEYVDANGCPSLELDSITFLPLPEILDTMSIYDMATDFFSFAFTTTGTPTIVPAAVGILTGPNADDEYLLTDILPESTFSITSESTDGCFSEVLNVVVGSADLCAILPDAPIIGTRELSECRENGFPTVSPTIPPGITLQWYADRDRAMPINTLDDFTPTDEGVYYVEAIDANMCTSAMLDSFSFTFLPVPLVNEMDTTSLFDDVAMTYSLGIPIGANEDLRVEPDDVITVSIDPATRIASLDNIPQGQNFNIIVISDVGCESDPFSLTLGSDPACPTVPDAPIVDGDAIKQYCENTPVPSFVVNNLPGFAMVQWYENQSDLIPFITTSDTFQPTAAGSYFAEIIDDTNCASDRVEFIAEEVPQPDTIMTSVVEEIDGTFTYSVSIDAMIDIDPMTTGMISGVRPDWIISGIAANESFDLIATADNTCVARFTLSTDAATACPVPLDTPVLLTDLTIPICEGDPIPDLLVEVNLGEDVNWYDDSNSGFVLSQGPQFTPSNAGIYFAEAFLDVSCVSDRLMVEIIENPLPRILNNTIDPVCDIATGGYGFTLDAPDAVSVNTMGFGAVSGDAISGWMISGLPAATSFEVTITDANGCTSKRGVITDAMSCVACPAPPDPPVLLDPAQAQISRCLNQAYESIETTVPSGFTVEWFKDGISIGTGTSFTIPEIELIGGEIKGITTDGASCVGVDSLTVDIMLIAGEDATFGYTASNCEGDPVIPTIIGDTGGTFTFLANPVGAEIDMATGEITNQVVGSYRVEYTTPGNTCSESDTVNFDIYDDIETTFYNVTDFDNTTMTYGIEFGLISGGSIADAAGYVVDPVVDDTFRIRNIPLNESFDLIVELAGLFSCFDTIPVMNTVMCGTVPPPVVPQDEQFQVFCPNDPVPTLSATVEPGQQVVWYNADSGGTIEGQGTFTPDLPIGQKNFYAEAVDEFGCVSEQRQIVTLSPLMPLLAGRDTAVTNMQVCFRDTLILSDFIPQRNGSYILNGFNTVINRDTLFTSGLTPDSNYEINYVVLDPDCGRDTAIISFLLEDCRPPVEVNSILTDVDCHDSENGSFTISVSVEQNESYTFSYSSTDAISRPLPISIDGATLEGTVIDLEAGRYVINTEDQGTVIARDTIEISAPAELTVRAVEVSQIICSGSSDAVIQAAVTGGTAPYNISWSNGETGQELIGIAAGMYTVMVTDDNGCVSDDASVNVTDTDPITFDAIVVREPLCADFPDGIIEIQNLQGGEGPYEYVLNGQAGLDERFDFIDLGTYSVGVRDARGCFVSGADQIEINSYLDGKSLELPAEVFLNPGEMYQLPLILNNIDPTLIQWAGQGLDCFDCSNPNYTMTEEAVFFAVEVIDDGGCVYAKTITLWPAPEPNIYIPNVITQAERNLNDPDNKIFFPYVADGIEGTADILIFDQWGSKVFSQLDVSLRDKTSGWDGKLNDKNVSENVYVYFIRVRIEGRTKEIERTGSFLVLH